MERLAVRPTSSPSVLLTTDWHLTDREADAYRWKIFEFLDRQLAENPSVRLLAILGDITDRRDNHSSILVNELIDGLTALQRSYNLQIIVLGGNHDRAYGGPAYFEWVNRVPNLHYVAVPEWFEEYGMWALPYTDKPDVDWVRLHLDEAKMIIIHQAVEGAVSANGFVMEPDCRVVLPKGPLIFSGHIHKPQTVSGVTYVGAPYHTAFGDDFIPRVLLVDPKTKQMQERLTGLPCKRIVRCPDLEHLRGWMAAYDLNAQDHIRLIYTGSRSDLRSVETELRDSIPVTHVGRVEFMATTENTPTNGEAVTAPVAPGRSPEDIVRLYLERKGLVPLTDLALSILAGATDLEPEIGDGLEELEKRQVV